jgi:hypothetical protein
VKDYVLDANAVLRYFGASEGQGTNKVRSACQNSDRSFVSLAYVLPGGSIQNREDAAKTDSPSAILSAKRATVAARPHQNSLSSVGRYKSVAFARDFL